jgi:hypothetical protein
MARCKECRHNVGLSGKRVCEVYDRVLSEKEENKEQEYACEDFDKIECIIEKSEPTIPNPKGFEKATGMTVAEFRERRNNKLDKASNDTLSFIDIPSKILELKLRSEEVCLLFGVTRQTLHNWKMSFKLRDVITLYKERMVRDE